MSQEPASLFVRLPVIYEGPEYLDFIAFGTGGVHFGIQKAEAANDPPGVFTWQIRITDIERAMERCQSADISFELEPNEPAPGWTYRRLLIRTPSGYRRPGTPGRHDPSWTAATRAVSPAHRTARKYGNAACQSPASPTSSADLAGTTARHPAAPLVRTKG